MAIQRWDPQRDLVRLQRSVNRMFDDVLARSAPRDSARGAWQPPVDVIDDGDHYVLRVDLPGVAPTDVDVRVEDGEIVVSGERTTDVEHLLRAERPSGRFATRVTLPESVERGRIEATHQNGVLEVRLPRRVAASTGRIAVADGAH